MRSLARLLSDATPTDLSYLLHFERRLCRNVFSFDVDSLSCSFSSADKLWGQTPYSGRTRGSVLQEYMLYCDKEEEKMQGFQVSPTFLEELRKRLVAVPFHLFVGEEGSDDFQRRLKKLREKSRMMKASSILAGAASFVPGTTLDKPVDDFVSWEDIVQYDGGLKRGSAMQRVVY